MHRRRAVFVLEALAAPAAVDRDLALRADLREECDQDLTCCATALDRHDFEKRLDVERLVLERSADDGLLLRWRNPTDADLAGASVRWYRVGAGAEPGTPTSGQPGHLVTGQSALIRSQRSRPLMAVVFAYDRAGNVSVAQSLVRGMNARTTRSSAHGRRRTRACAVRSWTHRAVWTHGSGADVDTRIAFAAISSRSEPGPREPNVSRAGASASRRERPASRRWTDVRTKWPTPEWAHHGLRAPCEGL